MSTVRLHRARNKAGREMIERVLRYATRIDRTEYDLVTDQRLDVNRCDLEVIRRFIADRGRAFELYEIDETTFAFIGYLSDRCALRYKIRTAAMME